MFISIKWRRSYDAFSYLDRALLDAAVGEDVARAPPHLLVHALLRANEQRFVSFRSVPFQTETSRFKNQPFQKLLYCSAIRSSYISVCEKIHLGSD